MFTISIIIPCYNGWQYMGNCLRSLENQTLLPNEIIIVDDCSTDNSFEQLTAYATTSKLPIKLIKNQKNSGPGYSRETGAQHATMDYVAFCDCDDWYELDFIESIRSKVTESHADLIVFDNYIVFEDDAKAKRNSTKNYLNSDFLTILARYEMSLWRLVVKKDILNQVTHSHLFYAEDAVVATQLIANSKNILVLDTAFYNYLHRAGSASNKPSPNIYKSFEIAYSIIRNTLENEYPQETEFIGIKMICYGATLNAFKAGIKKNEVKRLINEFTQMHERWQKNKYLPQYDTIKRIYVFLIGKRMFVGANILAKLHSSIVRLKKTT